jgi:hypothetical protein
LRDNTRHVGELVAGRMFNDLHLHEKRRA